jgi:hypothetical protein
MCFNAVLGNERTRMLHTEHGQVVLITAVAVLLCHHSEQTEPNRSPGRLELINAHLVLKGSIVVFKLVPFENILCV